MPHLQHREPRTGHIEENVLIFVNVHLIEIIDIIIRTGLY